MVPTRCLQDRPVASTVIFLGSPLNLVALQQFYPHVPFDHSYLSLIFQGKRCPRSGMARRIAYALGMSVEAFVRGQAAIVARRRHRVLGRTT